MNFEEFERVPVPFAGEGSGTGELTWTQQAIWTDMLRAEISLAMTAVRKLDPGATVDEFVDEYRFYLNRYQAMRTQLRFEPDGRPTQVVHASGTAEIRIYEVGDGDPEEVATYLADNYGFARFDYERDWPMRLMLLRHDGVLTHAVMAIAHHMADSTAAMAMFEDLRDRDPVTGEPQRPPGIQPLEQALLQQTPAAQRQNQAAVRYWEEQLRVIPPTMFPSADGIPDPEHRYWYADFISPAMHDPLHAIAAKLGGGTGSVLYAGFATAMAQVTGVNHIATMITVNNRFRPGLANAAGHMIQHGLCTLDTSDASLEELAHKARRRLLVAQKYGYYVQADVDELVERVGRERGITFDLYCLYNDRRSEEGPTAPPVPPGGEAGASILTWRKVDHMHHRMIFHLNDAPAGAIAVQVQLDTAYISRAKVVTLLERLEQVVTGRGALTWASR